jgi:5-methylcytosine-specific restriction endonuclease McrA
MDATYSKKTFGIYFPFCAPVEDIPLQKPVRYWRDIYVVRGKTLRVCSQWYDPPTTRSRELFCQYILSKNIATGEEVSALETLQETSLQSPSANAITLGSKGRYKGNAIGNAQNLFVRNILSNLGYESFSEKDWRDTKSYFLNRCAYCGMGGDLVMDHAVPINKAKLGEHRIGNLVPSCKGCNDKKGDRDYREYLAGDNEKIKTIELYMESRNYVPLGDNEQVRMILELAHKEVSTLANRYVGIINSLFPDNSETSG